MTVTTATKISLNVLLALAGVVAGGVGTWVSMESRVTAIETKAAADHEEIDRLRDRQQWYESMLGKLVQDQGVWIADIRASVAAVEAKMNVMLKEGRR